MVETVIERNLQQAANLLAQAWQQGNTIPKLPAECRPQSREDAYVIQDEMTRLLGYDVAGWKVGAASPGQMQAEGLDGPLMGRILAPTVAYSPAQLAGENYQQCMLECEFAFRLTQDFSAKAAPYSAEQVSAAAVLVLAIELTGTRYAPGYKPDFFCNMADNGNSGGLVLGAEIDDWQHLKLKEIHVDCRIDDGPSLANLQGDWRVDPLQVLTWTVNSLSERGIGLSAGAVVSTGSATQPQAFKPGSSAIAHYQDLGELRVSLTV